MKTLDNIDRISPPSAEAFWNDYVRERKPVVIRGLFEGQEVRKLNTLDKAVERLGGMTVGVRDEYTKSYFEGRGFGSQPDIMDLRTYIEKCEANPGGLRLVTEYDSPDELRRLYEVPDLTRAPIGNQRIFAASAKDYGHMHHDWTADHNLLFQLFGRKRFIVIPASSGHKLNPMFHVGTVRLANFSDEDKMAFVAYAGGYDFVLHPGEAVFMPMLDWHHIEYVDTAMSFQIRFGENASFKKLYEALGGDLSLHRDVFVQNIGASLTDEESLTDETKQIVSELVDFIRSLEADPFERHQTIQNAIVETHRALCPESEAIREYNHFPVQQQLDQMVKRFMGLA